MKEALEIPLQATDTSESKEQSAIPSVSRLIALPHSI